MAVSLSWALYLVSNASGLELRLKREARARELLYETYAQFLSQHTLRARLLEGEPVEFEKGGFLLRYQYQVFWPFADDYLKTLEIENFFPEEIFTNLVELPRREEIFLEVVRAEAWLGETLVARLFLHPPKPSR